MLSKFNFNVTDNEKYGLYFAGVLLACVVLFFYVIRPLSLDRAKLETQTLQTNTELAKLQTFATQNQDYDALVKLQEAKIADAKKKLPDRISVPDLIQEYTQLAEVNEISLDSLTPEESTKVGTAFGLPITMELTGDYFHMVNFLQQVENGDRFVSLQKTTFGAEQEGGSLKMGATFIVYSLGGADMTSSGQAPAKEGDKAPGKIGHEVAIEKQIKAAKS